jgi:hypothetical protein
LFVDLENERSHGDTLPLYDLVSVETNLLRMPV